MFRQITNSSALSGFEWENDNLTIFFTNGDVRLYRKVPKKVADELFEAKSAGLYFNTSIRDVYPVEEG